MKNGKIIWWVIVVIIAIVIIWQYYWTDEKSGREGEKLSPGTLDCMRKEMTALSPTEFDQFVQNNFSEKYVKSVIESTYTGQLSSAGMTKEQWVQQGLEATMRGIENTKKKCKNA